VSLAAILPAKKVVKVVTTLTLHKHCQAPQAK
jgi:hypothetical protein